MDKRLIRILSMLGATRSPWCWMLLLAVTWRACAISVFAAWPPTEFPISYWYGPPPGLNRLDVWQTVRDCNFTVAGPRSGYSVEDNRKLLDFCRQVGLQAIIEDGRINWTMTEDDNWKEVVGRIVRDYAACPALFGYFVHDEPDYPLFPPLGQISREFQQRDPRHLPYINLFPTYASVSQLGAPTYADYVEKFLTIAKPAVLSYDHYCLKKDGSDRPDYFGNLGLIREHALAHGVPPWNVILSALPLKYRDPTAAEMRWQIYTSLAYGMKGLMYYTYWTEKSAETNGTAIVNSEGKPARLYPIVRQLNAEIKLLGRTLLGLTSTGVFHSGDVPPGCTRLDGDALLQVSTDAPLVLGFFQDTAGTNYAMIVNRDHQKPAKFDATFKSHVTSVIELKATGGEAALPLARQKLHLTLDPGDGKLFRLDTQFRNAAPEKPLTVIDSLFKVFGRKLPGLTSTGVFHTGDIPSGCTRLDGDALLQVSTDAPLVLGFFQDTAGTNYVMIVNRDHQKPAKFDATFKSHVTSVIELKATGGEAALPLARHQLHFTLEPGDGKLFRLATPFRYPALMKALTVIDFQFNKSDDIEGWGGFRSLHSPLVKNGTLTLTFKGRDPSLYRTRLHIPPGTYRTIKVRMKLPRCRPTGQLFWTTREDPQVNDDKYLDFPVIPDGQWHEYAIPVAKHAKWQGHEIRSLRLDPTSGGAAEGSKVEIDWIVGAND